MNDADTIADPTPEELARVHEIQERALDRIVAEIDTKFPDALREAP